MKTEKLIVVGNGMVCVRLLEQLLKAGRENLKITVFGKEPFVAYDRIQLSSVLCFEKDMNAIVLRDRAWYEENGIELRTGTEIIAIDRENQKVMTENGDEHFYDQLVLATGSEPALLPIKGDGLRGIVAFRNLHDVELMAHASVTGRYAVVIGGGLLGLEAAYALAKRGMSVTVAHLHEHIMERQLDRTSADLLMSEMEAKGVRILVKKVTTEFIGDEDGHVRAVRFEDGNEIPADLVVTAIGINPRIALAQNAGLSCRRGVLVNDQMRTTDERIFAIGECAQHRDVTFGLVEPLYDMAKVCADGLLGEEASFRGAIPQARLKVTGINVFSVGTLASGGNSSLEELILLDRARRIYKKLVVRGDRLIGVILYGDVTDATWYRELLKTEADLSAFRDTILLGEKAKAGGAVSVDDKVTAMADAAEVCGCNGVCKGTIVAAIKNQNLASLEDVRAHTKASSSCGSCTPSVAAILRIAAGPAVVTVKKQALCKCTELSHEEVRVMIRTEKLMSIPDVMRALDWKTIDGCHVCRPALNYYLICEFPATYQDHLPSRWVNERVHANIQKDGTYSVVPRMWGGLTSAKDLRVIADVVDKYKIPTVKVTGGQRLDLFGVKKEDLPGVWSDLTAAGMVSGHAYAKGLRTCKTCVGSEWCRFGVQDSTQMGVRLEKMTWATWTPAKVKLAASGCPRNCAEATIKDFGVVAVESGWEIHVGGNGGIKVRVADLLCKVETQDEVLEYCGAFMQLYRKDAKFKERTAHWIERVGIDFVRSRVVDDSRSRRELYQEFLESQRHWQRDPWAEVIAKSNQEIGSENERKHGMDQGLLAR